MFNATTSTSLMKSTISFSRLWLICLTVMAAVSFSSCGDETYDYSPLQGRWELYSVNGVVVPELSVSEFTFYSDGTGIYGQYNPTGQWYTYGITWETEITPGGAEYLYIYTGTDVWSYLIRLYYDRMELTDLDTGDRLVYNAF